VAVHCYNDSIMNIVVAITIASTLAAVGSVGRKLINAGPG